MEDELKQEINILIENKINSCQLDVRGRLSEMDKTIQEEKLVRAGMKDTLDDVLTQSIANHKKFSEHDRKEMKKYDDILDALKKLTEALSKTAQDTDENSNKLAKKERQEEVDAAVARERVKASKTFNEYKKRAVMTFISIATAGICYTVWDIFLPGVK